MKKRMLAALILCIFAVTALSAALADDTNLTIMWWGADARHEATMAVLNMYTEKTGVSFSPE